MYMLSGIVTFWPDVMVRVRFTRTLSVTDSFVTIIWVSWTNFNDVTSSVPQLSSDKRIVRTTAKSPDPKSAACSQFRRSQPPDAFEESLRDWDSMPSSLSIADIVLN
jgi:hypothetical protein